MRDGSVDEESKALIEAIVVGALVGAVVESGKRGLVKSWGHSVELPTTIKMIMIAILISIPAVSATTSMDYVTTALATVGSFSVARWCVASVIVLRRLRR